MDSDRDVAVWLPRFRTAAYTAGAGAIIWTLLMIIPLPPFSSIPPIIVGGGPGTWLVLGYALYLISGFGGLSALAMMLYTLEAGGRKPVGWMMALGLSLYYAGSSIACWLLGIAGFAGGYAYAIQHLASSSIQAILVPYLDPVTISSLGACAGAALLLWGISAAPTATGTLVGR